VADLVEEMEIHASMEASDRGLQFGVERQNAFKFTRPSGHVWLRICPRAEHVSIEIEDECGGLPPGAAEALFRPFEQGGADRTGLGLGLAISRQAVEADGGKISVRDIPGKGCVFIVEMPLAVGRPADD
jgi:signal transduction histidine kinase